METRLTRLNDDLGSLCRIVEKADVGPASQVVEVIGARELALGKVLARWRELREQHLCRLRLETLFGAWYKYRI